MSNNKPCPFCGSDNLRYHCDNFYTSRIVCSNCGVNGPAYWNNPEDSNSDEIGAWKKWNERI